MNVKASPSWPFGKPENDAVRGGVGAQTVLKAVWATLLKQPPDGARLIQGAEGTSLSGGLPV